jgi:branched-chain amino acid transport system substrate-binding protein
MRPEAPAARGLATAAAITALALGGCGGDDPPFKVGVVADCVGINRSFHDAELSGAELPLIERGAKLRGELPADGVTPVEVGGREVELVPGCTEIYEFSALTAEVRRLVEQEDVDAVVAAAGGADEVVLREVAKRYPEVVFLPVVHGPREVTLHEPAPNLFRVVGDHGQGVAGLGTYAYRDLGWRRAAVVLGNWDVGWGERDAFVAEFCSLGGSVESQIALDTFDPAGGDVDRIPRNLDGVAVFSPQLFGPAGFLQELARRSPDPAREIVVGPSIADDPALLGTTKGAIAEVTGGSFVDPERMESYLRSHAESFPGIPTDVARGELVTGYRDAVEALLVGLEQASGDAGRLPDELAGLELDLLGGPVHLDDARQAVISTSLVRIPPAGDTATPVRLQTIDGVDQSVGGLLEPSLTPGDRPASCRRGPTPPWSR